MQDVSPCKGVEKSPVYVSWPHFMYGDPELRRGVEGLSPDAEKHEFFFDIEPVSTMLHSIKIASYQALYCLPTFNEHM